MGRTEKEKVELKELKVRIKHLEIIIFIIVLTLAFNLVGDIFRQISISNQLGISERLIKNQDDTIRALGNSVQNQLMVTDILANHEEKIDYLTNELRIIKTDLKYETVKGDLGKINNAYSEEDIRFMIESYYNAFE